MNKWHMHRPGESLLKEGEKRDKYQELAREEKNRWNMKVTVISIVIGALGTVTKGLILGLEDLETRERMETIQTIDQLTSVKM